MSRREALSPTTRFGDRLGVVLGGVFWEMIRDNLYTTFDIGLKFSTRMIMI